MFTYNLILVGFIRMETQLDGNTKKGNLMIFWRMNTNEFMLTCDWYLQGCNKPVFISVPSLGNIPDSIRLPPSSQTSFYILFPITVITVLSQIKWPDFFPVLSLGYIPDFILYLITDIPVLSPIEWLASDQS